MDREDKDRLVERYLRGSARQRSHAEEKLLKEEVRRRRAERRARPPRPVWRARDADEDDVTEVASMRRERSPAPAPAAPEHAAPAADAPGLEDALVVGVARERVELLLSDGATTAAAPPHGVALAVGDRVAVERVDGPVLAARVRALRPRTSWLARPDPAHPERRLVLAANLDLVVCVVAAREPAWKPGFVDRVLLAAAEGRAEALVVVNKVDLVPDAERMAFLDALARSTAVGASVLCVSAATGEGLARLVELTSGRTCVLVGPSGVGKSSLVAALAPGTSPRVGPVRAFDGKGRHTTTAAQLVPLANGACLIDTPGIRQLGLLGLDPRSLALEFPDFAPHAHACRFADCAHVVEPGCAVRAAVEAGALAAERYAVYRRIRDSLA